MATTRAAAGREIRDESTAVGVDGAALAVGVVVAAGAGSCTLARLQAKAEMATPNHNENRSRMMRGSLAKSFSGFREAFCAPSFFRRRASKRAPDRS